jgi:two-component system, chemotaxis family, chemotaxis protein CheY
VINKDEMLIYGVICILLPSQKGPSMKALLVDDSASMRTIQKTLLKELKIDTFEARNSQEAINILSQNSTFDIILLDVNMPVMNGVETLKEIKKNNSLLSIPVVMCTSEGGRGMVSEAIKCGATNYVVKPFTPESFTRKIKTVLSLK